MALEIAVNYILARYYATCMSHLNYEHDFRPSIMLVDCDQNLQQNVDIVMWQNKSASRG